MVLTKRKADSGDEIALNRSRPQSLRFFWSRGRRNGGPLQPRSQGLSPMSQRQGEGEERDPGNEVEATRQQPVNDILSLKTSGSGDENGAESECAANALNRHRGKMSAQA